VPAVSGTDSGGEREVSAHVPEGVAAAARAAFSVRDRDAVLAELEADSADGTEGAGEDRTVVFAGGGLRISLRLRHELGVRGRSAELHVQPPLADDPEVDVRDRAKPEISAISPGRWSLEGLTPGPVRLVFQCDGRRVQSEWMRC
jgi:hypothetical protein